MKVAAFLVTTVATVGSWTHVGAVCTGGIPGVESTSLDVCCVEDCGVCGGVGCTPGVNSTLTASDCCGTEIVESGVYCDVSGAAPCILTTAPASNDSVCINGQTGVQDPDTDVCCPLECGDQCGGDNCGTIPGVNASQCCSSQIIASGAVCSDTVFPPCVVVATSFDSNSTCSNGLTGIEDEVNGACCVAACGMCGGEGCGNIAGLSGDDCCSSTILSNGTLCSVSESAPCIMEYELVAANSTCSNGIAGIEDTVEGACCDPACGQCGGAGCGTIPGLTGDDCCSSIITSNGTVCSVSGSAPCIIEYELVASNSTCSNGLAGIEDTVEGVCCDPACGQCGGQGCGSIPGLTGDDCCSSIIASNGTECSVTLSAPCIIEYELVASNSTCSNGIAGIEDTVEGACCDPACGQCGGAGCGNIPGLTGDDCCSSVITSNGTLCSVSGSAPCIIEYDLTPSNSTCSNGFPGIQDEDPLSGACCNPACGQCGGAGCGTIPGLTSQDCCSSTIESSGTLCSIAGSAPCIIDPPEVNSSTCPNGLAGVQDGSVCCAEACNLVCGGSGCGLIYGTAGASDCCSDYILTTGEFCEDGVVAPCIMVNGTYTPAPSVTLVTASPTTTPRQLIFTSKPTMEGQTMPPSITEAPTFTPTMASIQPTGSPTPAPTIDVETPQPSPVSRDVPISSDPASLAPTASPTPADTDASSGATISTGILVTLVALVAGTFAVFTAARN